jgi:hypothetical protein
MKMKKLILIIRCSGMVGKVIILFIKMVVDSKDVDLRVIVTYRIDI